jgi:DDE superfamily endonuclease
MPMPTFPLARLGGFRAELHACYTRRADALFELGDALLCTPAIASVAHLSLEPVHQRGWGSSYAALAHGRIDTERLRDLLAGCRPNADPPVFAVDVTTWPRCDAECSPARGYYYHPSRHSAGQPIIAGWAYQWMPSSASTATPGPPRSMPADCTRWRTPTSKPPPRSVRCLPACPPAVHAMVCVRRRLRLRPAHPGLADAGVAVLVRLRADRCFYADPPPRPAGATGRPRHGDKFNCADPTSWPTPTATFIRQDDQYGTVTVKAWSGLHPKQQRHPGHGSRAPRPIVRGTIICVQVERIPARTRPPKCCGCGGPAPAAWISTWPGGRMSAGSTWSTPSGSVSRRWMDDPRPRHPEQADR